MRCLMEHLSFLYITSRLFLPLWKLIRLSPPATQAASDEKGFKIRRRARIAAQRSAENAVTGGGGKFLDVLFVCDITFIILKSSSRISCSSLMICEVLSALVPPRPQTGCFSKMSLVTHALVSNEPSKMCNCFCLMQAHFPKKIPNNIWDCCQKFYFHHCVSFKESSPSPFDI